MPIYVLIIKLFTDDSEPPIISGCPGDIRASVDFGSQQTVVTWKEPIATDNFGRVFLIYNNQRTGSNFPVGSTNVVYQFADDSHNLANCNFTVFIEQGKFFKIFRI